jgi:phosphoribosylanthranilate isomerase
MHIKICGVTTPEDAELAARLGATAIGLNFYKDSPRFVAWETARNIISYMPPLVEPVAVLVNPPTTSFSTWPQLELVRTLQLHSFTPDRWPELLQNWVGNAVILAHGVADLEDRLQLEGHLNQWLRKLPLLMELRKSSSARVGIWPILKNAEPPAFAVLFDAKVPGQHGGTGQQAPWHLLADWQMPYPLILAGGLTPENVAEAIRIVRPYGVDVASGVESAPGVKEAEKMRRFIGNALEAAVKYTAGR